MRHVHVAIISIADACLGGLRERSALLIGPEKLCSLYKTLLQEAGMKNIFQESDYVKVPLLLPQVHLLMNMSETTLSAATIARGCQGRHTPLLIFDLTEETSVEEMAGLLPAVCLYTPADLRHILYTNTNVQIA